MAVYPLYVADTPYNAAELIDIDYSQAFDTIYLTHEFYPVSKLVRSDHNDWAYSEVSFGPALDAPTAFSAVATVANEDTPNSGDSYFPQDYRFVMSAVDNNGHESRPSAEATASNDTELPRNYTTLAGTAPSGDIDYYRFYKAHESGSFGLIGESKTPGFVDDGFEPNYAIAPLEGYTPFDGAGKYPARCGFWEQRLWLGNTTNSPNGLFASRSADFENMDYAQPQRENDSIGFSITTGESNVIEAILPMDRLLIGTSDNIFSLRGANDDILVPSPPPAAKRNVGRGISLPKPIVIGETAFYQPRTETGVRTLGYTFEIDNYRSNDVTIFAPHLFEDKRIVAWAYQPEPSSIIWTVLDDGALLTFTYEAEQQVWGWCEQDVGGKVLDVVCIPEGAESRVYFVVEREVNDATVRYVERLDRMKWTDYVKASHLDSSRFYDFAEATDTVTGLEHLEGETVGVLADGYATSAVVEGGKITLNEAASFFIVGLGYDAIVETLSLPQEDKKKITGEIFLELVDSFDVHAGRRENELQLVRTRKEGESGAPIMYTGQPEPVRPRQSVDRQATIVVKQTSPYPMVLTALHYGVEAKGRG